MNDTPETDAAIKNQSKWMRPFVSTTFDGITYDSPVASLCRKLERERDEAMTELEMWRDGNILHEIHRNELGKVERERDEAREAVREGWLAMDEIDGTDRINNWQNKYANILEDAK